MTLIQESLVFALFFHLFFELALDKHNYVD